MSAGRYVVERNILLNFIKNLGSAITDFDCFLLHFVQGRRSVYRYKYNPM